MKRFFALIPALALGTAMVAAQEPQPQPTQTQNTQTSVGQPTDTNEPVFKGCVSGTKDNYVLTSSDGQSFRLHSDKDIAEHVGKMVEIRGTMKKEGADRPADAAPAASMQEIDVADLKNVEGSCPSNDSSALPQSDASKTNEQASATEPAKTEEPVASESAAVSTENQPATETTSEPAAASANAEVKTETPAADASAEVKTETPAADASANAAVSADQSAASTSVDASANNATDQNATATAGNEQSTEASSAQLPQTASPLPLLGLLGFASTGVGFFLRRK